MNKYIDIIENMCDNKYSKLYLKIIRNAIYRKNIEGYTEKHHIVPKSFKLGGYNDNENIIIVTAREHFLLHYILCKMKTPYHLSMVSAFGKMNCDKHGNRYINSKLYEYYRKNIGKLLSDYKTGKISIYKNKKTKYIEKIEMDKFLNDGWMLGQYSSESTKNARIISNVNRSGFIWIHNEKTSMQIRKDEYDNYSKNGWSRGRGSHIKEYKVTTTLKKVTMLQERSKNSTRMCKDNIIKYIKNEHVNEHVQNGWSFMGMPTQKGKMWCNDTKKSFLLFHHEIVERGLLFGRIKTTQTKLANTSNQCHDSSEPPAFYHPDTLVHRNQ